MIEDKPVQGGERSYSFWDVQDQNAKLPVKQTTQSDLRKLLFPSKHSSTGDVTKAAKGAFKMMGKMAEMTLGSDAADSHGPPVSVLVFKLLDMVKINDDHNLKHHMAQGGTGIAPTPPPRAPRRAAPRPAAPRPSQQRQAPPPQQQHRPQPPPQQQRRPPQQHQQQQEASLMDFGDTPAAPAPAHHHHLHHATSSPPAFNETRAEKLKREYEEKNKTANRVWDDVDQRWVEVDPKQANSAGHNGGATGMPKKKEVGISMEASSLNAATKSANVQAAVNKRVNDMKESQEKALKEVREREQKKKMEEEEEDKVRKQLEPKIKAWAEEHGQKKQLRALLASLHTILWPGAKWKQISIGDVLPDAKCKKFFHKATLVVHPDKTHHLPPDQRFLAKRIFDALCQAKTDFDNGAK
jgi:hypothetical protein